MFKFLHDIIKILDFDMILHNVTCCHMMLHDI